MDRKELKEEICDACSRAEAVFYRYGIPAGDMEDLMQDVFLTAYAGIDKLKDESRLLAWVRGISRNKAREYWRSEARRRRNLSLDSAEGMAFFERTNRGRTDREGDTLYAVIAAEETLRCVCSAMAAMSEKGLKTVLLHDFRGYSLKEISELEGMNYATVRTIYNRAIKKLREITKDRSR